MAFVNAPKDLSAVKTKLVFNLTKRQLICFGAAILIGIPAYIFTRTGVGNSAAALLMIAVMLPLFFVGTYEKDGQPAEKILRNYVRCKFVWKGKRPYKTENLYEIMEKEGEELTLAELKTESKEGKIVGKQAETAAKKAVRKRQSGKGKLR